MSNWVDAERRYYGARGGEIVHEGVLVNLDRVDAMIPKSWGTRLIWNQSSPRVEWDVTNTIDQLVGDR